MPIPRYIATLALMPKSAQNKYWRYIEGALYFQTPTPDFTWKYIDKMHLHEWVFTVVS